MKTTKEILVDARNLLLFSENWTKGTMARNAQGITCESKDPYAKKWCLLGAISKESQIQNPSMHSAIAAIQTAAGGMSIIGFNDLRATTHEDVLRVLQTAIEQVNDE
jgi:hypothetical protein